MTLKEDIETMYNDGVTINMMLKTLHIGYSRLYTIIDELKEEGRIVPRRTGQRKQRIIDRYNPKHYSYNNHTKHYYIRRKGVYYGIVKTVAQAEKFVELMEECNWDYSKRVEIKKEVML